MVAENLTHKYSRPYTPRDAGTVEAFNNTIKTLILNVRLSKTMLPLADVINLAFSFYNNDRQHTSTFFITTKLHFF